MLLGGDVHHAYVSEVSSRRGSAGVFQIVCSPYRNRLSAHSGASSRLTASSATGAVFSLLARLAGVPKPSADWSFARRPTYDNSIGELELDGRAARVTLRRSADEGEDVERLVVLHRPSSRARNRPRLDKGELTHAST